MTRLTSLVVSNLVARAGVIARPQGTEWEQHDLLEIGKAEQKDVDEDETGMYSLMEVRAGHF